MHMAEISQSTFYRSFFSPGTPTPPSSDTSQYEGRRRIIITNSSHVRVSVALLETTTGCRWPNFVWPYSGLHLPRERFDRLFVSELLLYFWPDPSDDKVLFVRISPQHTIPPLYYIPCGLWSPARICHRAVLRMGYKRPSLPAEFVLTGPSSPP